jgi:hypothetical protein
MEHGHQIETKDDDLEQEKGGRTIETLVAIV